MNNDNKFENEITKVEKIILETGFSVYAKDLGRPWGGFYQLQNSDAKIFAKKYFPELTTEFDSFDNLSPKFLIVKPGKRLSWQYHYRRAEHWRVINGPVGVILSEINEQPTDARAINDGEIIQFGPLIRHRLIGLQNYGLVAEIWQHTEPNNPSNEKDIVRVSDDFGR